MSKVVRTLTMTIKIVCNSSNCFGIAYSFECDIIFAVYLYSSVKNLSITSDIIIIALSIDVRNIKIV